MSDILQIESLIANKDNLVDNRDYEAAIFSLDNLMYMTDSKLRKFDFLEEKAKLLFWLDRFDQAIDTAQEAESLVQDEDLMERGRANQIVGMASYCSQVDCEQYFLRASRYFSDIEDTDPDYEDAQIELGSIRAVQALTLMSKDEQDLAEREADIKAAYSLLNKINRTTQIATERTEFACGINILMALLSSLQRLPSARRKLKIAQELIYETFCRQSTLVQYENALEVAQSLAKPKLFRIDANPVIRGYIVNARYQRVSDSARSFPVFLY